MVVQLQNVYDDFAFRQFSHTKIGLIHLSAPKRHGQRGCPPRKVIVMPNQESNRNSASSRERRSYSDEVRPRRGNYSGEMQRSQGYEYDDDYNRGPAYYDDRGQYTSPRDRDGDYNDEYNGGRGADERSRLNEYQSQRQRGATSRAQRDYDDQEDRERNSRRREPDAQRQFSVSGQTPRDYYDDDRDDRGRSYHYGERDRNDPSPNSRYREARETGPYARPVENPLHSQRDYAGWRDESGSSTYRDEEAQSRSSNYRDRSDYGEFSSRGDRRSRPERDIR